MVYVIQNRANRRSSSRFHGTGLIPRHRTGGSMSASDRQIGMTVAAKAVVLSQRGHNRLIASQTHPRSFVYDVRPDFMFPNSWGIVLGDA